MFFNVSEVAVGIAAQQDLDLGRGFVKEPRRPQNPSRCLRARIRVAG